MAMRVRKDGRMFCARYHRAEDGDLYIPDDIHSWLTGADGRVDLYSVLVYNKETHEWFFIERIKECMS